jgi:hypothetical protein
VAVATWCAGFLIFAVKFIIGPPTWFLVLWYSIICVALQKCLLKIEEEMNERILLQIEPAVETKNCLEVNYYLETPNEDCKICNKNSSYMCMLNGDNDDEN